MVTKIDLMNNKTSIDVTDAQLLVDNFKTITFREGTFEHGHSYTYLEISDDNFNELGQKMFPDGLIPDDFHKKIAMMNQLIEELEDIQDKEQPDWELSKVYYNEETDTVFFDTKEVE